jgi:osmotically-inducible protein OsmY
MKRTIASLFLTVAVGVMPLVWSTGCAVTSGRESAGQYTDDKAITAKVKTALLRDPNVKSTQVNVTTYRGVVQLSGFVDSAFAKERAGELARQVKGVMEVHNDLVLPTGR